MPREAGESSQERLPVFNLSLVLDNHIGSDYGVDAIENIKPIAPDTRIVMLTTCFDSILRKNALARGACDFLTKSQPIEQISRRIFEARSLEPVEEKTVDRLSARKTSRRFARERWSMGRYVGGLHCCSKLPQAA